MSKFYSILSGKNQDLICNRLGLDNRKELDNWLINLNGIRNRCAHHARLCNRSTPRTLSIPRKGYFNLLALEENQKNKFYGVISVIWFLLKQIGPSSTWICRIADLIDQKPEIPGFTNRSMGFPITGFPRQLFPETTQKTPVINEILPIKEFEIRLNALLSFKDEFDLQSIIGNEVKNVNLMIDSLIDFADEVETALNKAD